jgi:pimeloyl-ACP methyl ester carboxylesterase
MHIYLLSGVGTDAGVFDYLDLSTYQISHIRWVKAEPHETLKNYAKRLLSQIHHNRPVLIGVSFGGMIAIEISKLIETEKVILISSVRTSKDIPLWYRLTGRLALTIDLVATCATRKNSLLCWLFGVKGKKEKDLLMKFLGGMDLQFLRWAIRHVTRWDNLHEPENAVTIHGTHDRIFPMRSADLVVDRGGHFMVVNKAEEISFLLRTVLKKERLAGINNELKVLEPRFG